jgi:hypothetical protein
VTPGSPAFPIHALIDRYHALLAGPLGRESVAAFGAAIRAARLTFGDRPICRVLRPYFLTARKADRIARGTEALLGAFRKVFALLDRDRSLRDILRLSPADEAVLSADRQPFEPDQISRLDGFLIRGGGYRSIEYNAESPGGIAFGDALAEIFRTLPVMQSLAADYPMTTPSGLGNTLRQLVESHERRVGPTSGPKPSIAVVDWKSAPTRREFEICADYFQRHGHPSRVVEPSALHLENGRLVAAGEPIDIVYKRALVGDLVRNGGADHPLVRAVREGLVTCASRFQVHILYRKEMFAFFHDPRIAADFSEAERAAVRAFVPWSRIVEDVEIPDGDQSVRLLDLIRRQREQLVLKPTSEYGGRGVVLGWHTTPEEWEAAIQRGLAEPHLVQERVALPSERFPVVDGDGISFADFYADLNPYVWGGVRSEGFGARLATGELLNVSAGGGSAVPVFVVDVA